MWNNVGKNIKTFSKIIFFIEAALSISLGLSLLALNDVEDAWWCILIIFIGPVIAWISSWILYGFGEIIDRLIKIEENTRCLKYSLEGDYINYEDEEYTDSDDSEFYEEEEDDSNDQSTYPVTCPKCGAQHHFDDKHCPNCGHKRGLFN